MRTAIHRQRLLRIVELQGLVSRLACPQIHKAGAVRLGLETAIRANGRRFARPSELGDFDRPCAMRVKRMEVALHTCQRQPGPSIRGPQGDVPDDRSGIVRRLSLARNVDERTAVPIGILDRTGAEQLPNVQLAYTAQVHPRVRRNVQGNAGQGRRAVVLGKAQRAFLDIKPSHIRGNPIRRRRQDQLPASTLDQGDFTRIRGYFRGFLPDGTAKRTCACHVKRDGTLYLELYQCKVRDVVKVRIRDDRIHVAWNCHGIAGTRLPRLHIAAFRLPACAVGAIPGEYLSRRQQEKRSEHAHCLIPFC